MRWRRQPESKAKAMRSLDVDNAALVEPTKELEGDHSNTRGQPREDGVAWIGGGDPHDLPPPVKHVRTVFEKPVINS
jgi:hypothetical protein